MEEKIINRLLVITSGAMLMNSKQLAQALGLHQSTISELKQAGLLGIPTVSGTGKRERFSVVAVARYLLGTAEPIPTAPEAPQSRQKPRRKIPSGLPTVAQIRAFASRNSD